MFNYNHLYYFYITAQLKGVTTAAKALNTSQPSLSTQIKSLEANLKKKLFRKIGRNLELTEEGQRIFNICKRMFEASEELEEFLQGDGSAVKANFTIGVSSQIERPFIAHIISTALKDHTVKNLPVIHLISRSEEEMRTLLKLHKLDLLITSQPIYDEEIEILTSLEMPVGFAAAPSLAMSLGLSRKALISENLKKAKRHLVMPTSTLRLRQETDLFLQRKRLQFHMLFESDILASLIGTMVEGMGAGFIPITYILRELKNESLRLYPGTVEGHWNHKLIVMGHQSASHSALIQNVVNTLNAEEDSIERLKV